MIVDLIFRLATMLFLVRFLLQACAADFYNPISQAIVKGSDSIAKPLRRLLPNTGRYDLASLLVAWLMGIIFIALVTLGSMGITQYLLGGTVRLISILVDFYWWSTLLLVIASFVRQGSYHPALALLDELVAPLMTPLRNILPTAGPLDFSPMVLILFLSIVQQALPRAYGLL
jgi:YggT family protein